MTIIFNPLPAPPEPQKKCRANAKPTVITKIDHFYEDVPLRDFLFKVICTNLKHEDLFKFSWLFQESKLEDPDSFTISYTVPWRVTDQVEISSMKDYLQMVDEAQQLSKQQFLHLEPRPQSWSTCPSEQKNHAVQLASQQVLYSISECMYGHLLTLCQSKADSLEGIGRCDK